MSTLGLVLLLAGIPVALLVAGYWLAARLPATGPGERLAAAALGGLGFLLWNVSVANFFLPLAGPVAWLCLWPVAITLGHGPTRRRLADDVAAVAFCHRGALAFAGAAAFLGFLLWPLFRRPDLVFYDGTGNHDAFFWITGADHLQRHSYMEAVTPNALHPAADLTAAFVGWLPEWGRMGSEGLLALLAALTRTAPLQLYVAATAALFVPWIAAVYLVARTFLVGRLTWPAALALVALQPAFVFFHGNANLPNLLGVLAGALVIVATGRVVRSAGPAGAWSGLLALGLHALFCGYPEMLPVIAVSAGLLWLRASLAARRPHGGALVAGCVGLALNPASTARAWHGLVVSFDATHHAHAWVNIFQPLSPAARASAMATLSPHFGHDLDFVGAALCAVILVAATVFALRRARDRFGTAALLAGPTLLLGYTLTTGFDYGWQKTAQVAAIAIAALVGLGGIDACATAAWHGGRRRFGGAVLAAALVAILGYATVVNDLESHKWSREKFVGRDWLALRDYARKNLPDAAVAIDGASFTHPFFYSMWAAYFLADCRIYFVGADPANGGYLHPAVVEDGNSGAPPAVAVLAGHRPPGAAPADSHALFVSEHLTLRSLPPVPVAP